MVDRYRAGGPAILAPRWIRDLILTPLLRIEFLDVSDPPNNYYPKNHIVGSVTFETPITILGVKYQSARLSMHVGQTARVEGVAPVSSSTLGLTLAFVYLTSFLHPGIQTRTTLRPWVVLSGA